MLVRVDGVEVEVLVAALIVNEQNKLAVTTPEETPDRAFRFIGQQARVREWLIRALDPNVQRIFMRFEEGDELAVGRNRRPRDFRVAEQYFAVNQWRQTVLRRRGRAE